jgi:hypothetical protein
MCKIAVKNAGGSLCYVPKKIKNVDICLIAVLQNIRAYKHIDGIDPDAYDEIAKVVVDENGCELLKRMNTTMYQYIYIRVW